MLAHPTYPERRENPLGMTLILVSAGLATVGAVGVAAGVATRKKRLEEAEVKPPPKTPLAIAGWVGVQQGGGPGAQTQDDETVMRSNGLFTTFFTREVEAEVISRMQAYKNRHKIQPGDCKPVSGVIMESGGLGIVRFLKYFDEGAKASVEILTDLYPTGAPWDASKLGNVTSPEEAEEGGVLLGAVGLWRWWLWHRVVRISDFDVCGFKPVT
jgi:hypothetical protein